MQFQAEVLRRQLPILNSVSEEEYMLNMCYQVENQHAEICSYDLVQLVLQ